MDGHPTHIALNNAGGTPPGHDVAFALNTALPGDGTVPEWVQLIPPGRQVEGFDGRAWVNDDPAAVVDAFTRHGLPLPVDFEHATERKGPQGDPAPAVGWIQELAVRDGGAVWARIAWTEEGQRAVASRAYRFISPGFLFRRDSGRIVAITSAGQTNVPNLRNALNRAHGNPQEQTMDVEKLLAALGLDKSATEG